MLGTANLDTSAPVVHCFPFILSWRQALLPGHSQGPLLMAITAVKQKESM